MVFGLRGEERREKRRQVVEERERMRRWGREVISTLAEVRVGPVLLREGSSVDSEVRIGRPLGSSYNVDLTALDADIARIRDASRFGVRRLVGVLRAIADLYESELLGLRQDRDSTSQVGNR